MVLILIFSVISLMATLFLLLEESIDDLNHFLIKNICYVFKNKNSFKFRGIDGM